MILIIFGIYALITAKLQKTWAIGIRESRLKALVGECLRMY
jgi:hypothetical protein